MVSQDDSLSEDDPRSTLLDLFTTGTAAWATLREIKSLRDNTMKTAEKLDEHNDQPLSDHPRLIDSLDVTSPEQLILNDTVTDKTLTRVDCPMPHGEESTTVRAGFMQVVALKLDYLLSPLCSVTELSDDINREADAMEW